MSGYTGTGQATQGQVRLHRGRSGYTGAGQATQGQVWLTQEQVWLHRDRSGYTGAGVVLSPKARRGLKNKARACSERFLLLGNGKKCMKETEIFTVSPDRQGQSDMRELQPLKIWKAITAMILFGCL